MKFENDNPSSQCQIAPPQFIFRHLKYSVGTAKGSLTLNYYYFFCLLLCTSFNTYTYIILLIFIHVFSLEIVLINVTMLVFLARSSANVLSVSQT